MSLNPNALLLMTVTTVIGELLFDEPWWGLVAGLAIVLTATIWSDEIND